MNPLANGSGIPSRDPDGLTSSGRGMQPLNAEALMIRPGEELAVICPRNHRGTGGTVDPVPRPGPPHNARLEQTLG